MKNDGGTAFPSSGGYNFEGQRVVSTQPGMSLRDYFAGQALAGLCGDPSVTEHMTMASMADFCWKMAEAMLAAREIDNGRTERN